jgi:nitroimidazol reductase NimA-like FMN-containing flavoprotein (pyridoxamine 5'-phosphate oxidase superfamily)
MDITHARSGLEIIPRKECLLLLAGRKVGRIGFIIADQPVVLPVNYVLVGDVVVFRTAEGAKLDALPSARVAFEVDEVDEATGSGWSVVVQGVAEEICADDDWFTDATSRTEVPQPWIPVPADHHVRIRPRLISGRRLRPSSPG